ncbi:hypothetical protein CCY01nite_07370 [Chitinophaga cymbidii]|uniref:Uncharacterized protein n=1 Tax=Chitinophaga cymbidii TaxID=1096750 RepID=A0A512RFI3_9BACT|nr:hypothetical protein CCY01nite_07370 [Chitinophaga cymbidii]
MNVALRISLTLMAETQTGIRIEGKDPVGQYVEVYKCRNEKAILFVTIQVFSAISDNEIFETSEPAV